MVLKEDMIERECKGCKCLLTFVGLQLTLPHNDYVPAHLGKFLLFFLVALFVSLDFLLPEVCVRLGHPEVLTAIMSVPKAAVDKHTRAVLAQHDIGMTGQTGIVQPITESLSPQKLTHKNLWLRVLRPI